MSWRGTQHEVDLGWSSHLGSSLLKPWSSTQMSSALRSADAELFVLSRCAQQALAVKSIAEDFGMHARITVCSDVFAALRIAYRQGLGGKTRHAKVQYLRVLRAVSEGRLQVGMIQTTENPVDLLTKCPSRSHASDVQRA